VRTARILHPLCLPALLALAACQGDDPVHPGENQRLGRLEVLLVDAPADLDDVILDIQGVHVHRADADSTTGWSEVRTDTLTVNLLALTDGRAAELVGIALAEGFYDRVRIDLGDNNVVLVDSVAYDLQTPPGEPSRVSVPYDFEVLADATHEAFVDIDAGASIVRHGDEFYLEPVVRAWSRTEVGTARGVVQPVDAAAEIWTVVDQDTVRTYADRESGGFTLQTLPPGVYDIHVTPTVPGWDPGVIPAIEVSAMHTIVLDSLFLLPPD